MSFDDPHPTETECPTCGGPAWFRPAFSLITDGDWPRWLPHLWPCARATNWDGSARWAPGDPSPTWSGWIIIEHDPAFFRWRSPSGGYQASGEGIVSCASCVTRRIHSAP